MKVTPTEAKALARSAYLFVLPLVNSYRELYLDLIDETSSPPTILGSSIWLDLRTEPWLVKQPALDSTLAAAPLRSCRAFDLWSFAIGECTPATDSAVMLAPPTWADEVPTDVIEVVRGDSAFVYFESWTKMPDPHHGSRARTDQLLQLEPLSTHLGRPAPPSAPPLQWKPCDGGEETRAEFWSLANFALSLTTPHSQDREILERVARLGIIAGIPWAESSWSPDVAEAIGDGMADALSDLMDAAADPLDPAKILRSRADTDRDYFHRALASLWRGAQRHGVVDRSAGRSTSTHDDPPARRVRDGSSP